MLKLWNSNTISQVSSRRFFMYCPCLYGLKASPVRLKKKDTEDHKLLPANKQLLLWNLTWSRLMLVLILRSELSVTLSSTVRWSLLWRSAWGSLRGLTARLHLVIPRRAGPQSCGWLTSCRDIQLLNPIQSEIPELRIICRENRPVILSEAGFFTTLSKYVEPSGGGLHHLGNILPCCKASFVQLRCCHSMLELLPDLEEFRKTHLNS